MQTPSFAIKTACLSIAFTGMVTLVQAQNYNTPPPPRPMEPSTATTTTSSSETTVSSGTNGRLQVEAPTEGTQTKQPAVNNNYLVNARPRSPATGYSVAVYGGINVATQDELESIGGVNVSSSSEIAPMVGLKFGHIWAFTDEPIEQFELETGSNGGIRLSGGLEADAFYLRNDTKINSSTNSDKVEMNMGFLMVNATLQAQWGKFRLYGGPGVGGAIINASNYGANGTPDFSYESTQVRLAFQGLGGLDYFVTPEWSIFGEYKYLLVNGLGLSNGATEADFGQMGQHILAVGVRKHF